MLYRIFVSFRDENKYIPLNTTKNTTFFFFLALKYSSVERFLKVTYILQKFYVHTSA